MEGQNLSAIAPSFLPFGGALGSARQAWVLTAAVIMLPTGDLGILLTTNLFGLVLVEHMIFTWRGVACNVVHGVYGNGATDWSAACSVSEESGASGVSVCCGRADLALAHLPSRRHSGRAWCVP